MNSRLLTVLTLASFLAAGATGAAQSPAPAVPATSPAATPAPIPSSLPENGAVTLQAKAEWAAWASGNVDRTKYSKQMSDFLTDASIGQVSAGLKSAGPISTFIYRGSRTLPGAVSYIYSVTCANGRFDYAFALGDDGKIVGIYFKPQT